MKNASTHKGKGKHWGKLTAGRKKEYDQTTSGSVGHSSAKKGGFFLGDTVGNKNLPPNRS